MWTLIIILNNNSFVKDQFMGLRGIWEGFIFTLKYYYDKVYITVNAHKLGQGTKFLNND